MTPEKILEIARRYGKSERKWVPVLEDGKEIGIVHRMMMWDFCEEELLAFAKDVIEADREKRKPLSDEEIESVISNHRFAYGVDITAYRFARAVEKKVLEKMHGIGEAE